MALLFLLALIAAPLAEISVFIAVGGEIGALPVLLLTIATAVIGVTLVRAQGFETIRQARAELDANRAPLLELMHGAFLALAGLMLLIPGFLSDFLGALLLIPPLRLWIILGILRRTRPQSNHVIIEGTYWENGKTPEDQTPDQTSDQPSDQHLPPRS
ncbi:MULTISPECIES: FxsA family protein [unclassified Iodidimonas]|jgi:UPF0716 protein FxsA|uniref:FxsA family protein n=1 Tax=unclassified Iodidimonas TaxID=2626145 RepID=UPI0024828DC5|nr:MULTISPECIES: FxsA family protein [unclassified Iodidimonas]